MTRRETPTVTALINNDLIQTNKAKHGISELEHASIRQLVMLISDLESASGNDFVRMELGVPGLAPAPQAIAAEHKVLDSIKVTQYPALNGNPGLRDAYQSFLSRS